MHKNGIPAPMFEPRRMLAQFPQIRYFERGTTVSSSRGPDRARAESQLVLGCYEDFVSTGALECDSFWADKNMPCRESVPVRL